MMNKRIFATLVAMGMVASMGTMAVSAEPVTPATTGDTATYSDVGKVEDIIDTSIVTAELPTIADGTFDFILDPQKLLQQTATAGGSLGTGKTIAGTLLFNNDTDTYGETSAEVSLKFVNAVDTDVTVAATLAQTGDLKFSTSDDFGVALKASTNPDADKKAAEKAQGEKDAAAHVYLAISDTTTSTPVNTALDAKGGKYTKKVNAIAPANLKVTYANSKYSYDADDTNKSEFKFKLTGKTNAAAAGWDELKGVTPTIDLTWTLKKHVDSLFTQTSVSSTDAVAEFAGGALPEGVTVTAVTGKFDGGDLNMLGSYARVVATGIEIDTAICTYHAGKTIEVTFSNGKTEVINVNS